jgi:hypothetical protein
MMNTNTRRAQIKKGLTVAHDAPADENEREDDVENAERANVVCAAP